MKHHDSVLTITELSEYLKVSRSTLYKLAQEGKVPGQKVGRHWRFRKKTIDKAESDKGISTATNGGRTALTGAEISDGPLQPSGAGDSAQAPVLRRFHGSVHLDPVRLGRDASRIAEEVVQHLAGIVGAEVEVTLEIKAELQDDAPEKLVRDVTENCRTLKFETYGFEEV
ncbi:MAG: hypothetical protein HJJLKODD_02989 [Phycisphaerae bacterium]|nr:hypothetical protein [Phycisphaerae bacterium]